MKKIIFVAGAMLMVSVAAIVGYKAYDRTRITDFVKANLEALSQNESTSTLSGVCEYSIAYTCYYVCKKCNHKWENRVIRNGRTIAVIGNCSCGEPATPPYYQ